MTAQKNISTNRLSSTTLIVFFCTPLYPIDNQKEKKIQKIKKSSLLRMLQDKKGSYGNAYVMFLKHSLPAAIKLFNTCNRLAAGKAKSIVPRLIS